MENKTNNSLKIGIGISTIVGVAVLLIVSGSSSTPDLTTYSASVLTSAESEYDFGNINMQGGNVTRRFTVQNDGVEPVAIKKVYTSCMCTTAEIMDEMGESHGMFGMPGHGSQSQANVVVKPGESIFVDVVFDPAAHGPSGVGLAERSIYLETNSIESPKLELSFRAMVTR